MAFESLTDRLAGVFKKLRGHGKLTEADIKAAMREVRMALLEADVNYKVAKDFCAKVSERAMGQEVMESLTPAQQVVKIVNEELTELMGGSNARLQYSSSPISVFMLCGLQGAGKTTMSAKLANWLKKDGKRPLLVGCDIYRPAAIKQLQVVGGQVGVPVYEHGTQDPVKTALEAVEYARQHQRDVVILDTAGRLHIDEQLMDALCENIEGEIPEVMFENEAENCVRDYESRLRYQGMDLDTFMKYTGQTVETLKGQFRPQAEKQVKTRLALEYNAKAENLTATEEDIGTEYQKIADAYGLELDRVKESIDEKAIAADVVVGKAALFVHDNAVISGAAAAAPKKRAPRKKKTVEAEPETVSEASP